MNTDNKQSDNKNSSAEHVDEHLQALGNDDARELLYYSQEQPFSTELLGSVINESRLMALLAESDAFINSVNGEIKDFDEDDL